MWLSEDAAFAGWEGMFSRAPLPWVSKGRARSLAQLAPEAFPLPLARANPVQAELSSGPVTQPHKRCTRQHKGLCLAAVFAQDG